MDIFMLLKRSGPLFVLDYCDKIATYKPKLYRKLVDIYKP